MKSTTLPIMRFVWMLMLSVFSVSSIIHAQQVSVKAKLDSASLVIGDQIHLSFQVQYDPQQYRVAFPQLPDTFNHLEVVNRGKIDTIFGRNTNTYSQTYTLTGFDSGVWKIPSFSFDVQSLKGANGETLLCDSFLVKVNSISVDTTQAFKPIFGIRGAKLPLKEILLYALGIVLILLALILLIIYIRKRRKQQQPLPEALPPLILPHQKATLALQKIESLQLWQQGLDKEYHTQVSDVIRLYLEEQFGIDCLEKTSNEILQQLRKHKILSLFRPALQSIFETADMVKFAKSKPGADEHIQSMTLSVNFVVDSYARVKPLQTEAAAEPHAQ